MGEHYSSGTQSRATDSKRQKWVKLLNVVQSSSLAISGNNPNTGNSRREVIAKCLATIKGVKLKQQ